MGKNLELKMEIFKSGKSQAQISRETGIPQSYLSFVVGNRMVLTDKQKKTLAKAIGKTVEELNLL